MKFSIKDFLRKLCIWSHLLKKFLMEDFIFCVMKANFIAFYPLTI